MTKSKTYAIIRVQKRKGIPKMTTLEYTITNNLMAGLALKDIESKIPCFYNISDTDFENLEDLITVTIHCRKEDEAFVKAMLAPFV